MDRTKRTKQPKMWRVLVPVVEGDAINTGSPVDIVAIRGRLIDGCAEFSDEDGDILEAFAPGCWMHVSQVVSEEDDPADDYADEVVSEKLHIVAGTTQ